MKLKKLGIAVATAAALGAGTINQARADAFAESLINVRDFFLSGPTGAPLTLTDFSQLSFQDTLTNTAILNGASDFQHAETTSFQASPDAPQACVDTCTHPQNDFVPDVPLPTAS